VIEYGDTAFVPVYWGMSIAEYAWVDAADVPMVARYKWVHGGNYAVSSARRGTSPTMTTTAMHRYLLGLSRGEGIVHHINEDTWDNRRANLKTLPDKFAHGAEPHPRRNALCGHREVPEHARVLALAEAQA
jgi:hypothetical protein